MGFTDAQLLRFYKEAEDELASLNLIRDRMALSIISGVGEYTLPEYVIGIRGITYQGTSLNPYRSSEMIRSGSAPMNVQLGEPKEYVYSYKGVSIIRLYPTPNLTIAAPSTSLWETAAIQSGVVIEFYRTPDYNQTVLNRIPPDIRDNYLDDYVFHRSLGIESKEMDIQASTFYGEFWMEDISELSIIKQMITKSILHEIKPIISESHRRPSRPMLPTNFGKVVS